MSSADLHFNNLLQFVTSSEGAILVLVGVVLAMLGSQKPIIAWGFLVMATMTASLTQPASVADAVQEGDISSVLAPGLTQLQTYGRIIAIAGLAGAFPFLMAAQATSLRPAGVRPITFFFAILHIAIVFKYVEYRLISYAVLGGVTYALMYFVLGLKQTTWVPTWASTIWPIRAVAAATGLFILGVVYQASINAAAMTGNTGRLQGLTANPQHAATLLAAGFPAICCLWELDRRDRLTHWFYLVMMGLSVVLIAWTSSRTGGLMCAVSLATMYRRQLRKLVILGILCAGAVLGTMQFFSEISDTAELMVRADDTRSAVWANQFKEFLRYPITGSPANTAQRLGVAENSWLAAASAIGLMGLLPLCGLGLACWRLCVRCARVARTSDVYTARIADTVIAGFAAIGSGSIFEGYLLGVLNFQIFAVGLYAMAGYACVEFDELASDEFPFTESAHAAFEPVVTH